jgi:hypothetical protein
MKKNLIFVSLFLFLFLFSYVSAQSNQSMNASSAIADAQKKMDVLVSRDIPTARANDSLNQAIQLYSAQFALESSGRQADYTVVFKYLNDFSTINDNALKAQDELNVFNQALAKASTDYNFSSMNVQLVELNTSFTEQRFEDTLTLVNQAYDKMYELESSQTKLNLFYSTATKTLKQFLVDNWKTISLVLLVLIISIIIFWRSINTWNIKRKLRAFQIQKEVLLELIKKLQYNYFKKGIISETEFNTRLETFKELIRDLDRKIPLLREDLAKTNRTDFKKSSKNSSRY